MAPTAMEIIFGAIFGIAILALFICCLLIYLVDKHNSYESNRLHPERYGKISTHYWC